MDTEGILKKKVYDLQEQLVVANKKVVLLKDTIENINTMRSDCMVSIEMMEQYYNLQREIYSMKNSDGEEYYEGEDLGYNEKLLDACTIVLKHYTGYSDLPEELRMEYTTESNGWDEEQLDTGMLNDK
tara:strand:+ start:66 stop:449 length:384 start_codon:yes stop_codon:yes gene_type:complete